MTNTRLERSSTDKIIGGVCGGIAQYANIDATIVRILAALVVLLTGVGPIVYILLWILLPLNNGRPLAQEWTEQATDWYEQNKARPTHTGGNPAGPSNPTNPTNPTSTTNPGNDTFGNQMPNSDDLR